MGNLVTQGATVICAHGGQATPTVPNPRVKAAGQATVTLSAPWTIAGCSFPPPPTGTGPCVTGQWVVGTVRVTSMGQPLVIQGGSAVCVPTGVPLTVTVVQPRVVAT
jgi:hypothetical protein